MLSNTLSLFLLPLLVVAQSSSQGGTTNSTTATGGSVSQTVYTTTSISTGATLGPDRQESTATRTFIFTITSQITPLPSSSGNSSASGNATASGNFTSSASTTTTPANLPTAPSTIAGGGTDGVAGAPMPGEPGGIYGPDDSYIAAASSLKRSTLFVGVAGLVIGGALVVL